MRVNTQFTMSYEVKNAGKQMGQRVRLTDAIPDTFVLHGIAAPANASCTYPTLDAAPGGLVSCDLGDIPAGRRAVVTLTLSPRAAGVLSNTAQISSYSTDTDTRNNSRTISVTAR